tara:strand:+ start:507 stop:2141 length:1635 start_codon:yes stop_codon:yes gene_type:complete
MHLLPPNDKYAAVYVRNWIFTFFIVAFSLHVWRIFSLNATYDQGLFLQEIWNGLFGRPFESTLASELSAPVLIDGALPQIGYKHLGQHFTPLLVAWIPIVGVLGVWALPLIQVGLISLSGWILFLLGKENLPPKIAGWITCSFFVTATVLGPALENFHDLCLVPLLVFILLLGISRNDKFMYYLPALLLPLIREDVGLISFGIGFWMFLRRPTWRLSGLFLCIYSVIYVLIITNWIMPLFGSELSRRFMQERFSQYLNGQEGGTLDVLLAMFSQPALLLKELISPPLKTFSFLLTLALPLGLIPWFSKDSWLLIIAPLFVALSSKGGNAMSVSLRFMLYLVPGIFAGSIFWWKQNQKLFSNQKFRRFWKISMSIAFAFALIGNPHRSLSAIIPDSVDPWVHVPIDQAFKRGWHTSKLLRTIPKDASISAETQLIPQLAQRRLLLRFPENYQYQDLKGDSYSVQFVISQLRYNGTYAPAFSRQARWVEKSIERMQYLMKDDKYGIKQCNQNAIVLQLGLTSSKSNQVCFDKEIKFALETLRDIKR